MMNPNLKDQPLTVKKASDANLATKKNYVAEMEKIQTRVAELHQLNAESDQALITAIVQESKNPPAPPKGKAKPSEPDGSIHD